MISLLFAVIGLFLGILLFLVYLSCDSIEKKLDQLTVEVRRMNATTDTLATEITALQQQVTAETTVEQSAITLINGFSGQLAAAVAAAQAAGATPDQLTALHALDQQIQTSSAALAAAVSANTPAAPPASGN